eukprot:gene57157-biopygen31580
MKCGRGGGLEFWASSGPVLGQSWTSSGPVLDQFWTSPGPVLGQFWAGSGPDLGQFWASSGPVPRSPPPGLLDHIGSVLDQF